MQTASISDCNLFLAILTPELKIDDFRRRESFVPSVWVVEEKGMALGLGKPFRMLVHEQVHEDFWLRTTPGDLHHVFNDTSFDARLEDALIALGTRFEERQLASAGVTAAEL